ncbi:sodium metabolite cotransporter [Pycnococcus provasolii]
MHWFPWGFFVGLCILATVPTTLSSGVTLVAIGKGNAALALMIVVVTNALGVVVTPLWIQAYAAASLLIRTSTTSTSTTTTTSISNLDSTSLLINLVLTVLVPLVAGKVVREILHCVGGDGSFFDMQTHKRWLVHVSSLSLIIIVWMNVSVGEAQLKAQNGKSISTLVALGILFHLTLLALNAPVVLATMRNQHTASQRWWLPSKEGKAALILSSQKTLPVSLTVLSMLPSEVFETTSIINDSKEQRGLAAVACVVAQICELFMDGAIASWWAGLYVEEEEQ